jgi:small conductance mechanosensitive channel
MVFTSTLGFQTPQFLTAVVTSISLAVGLSFQSVLSNFAAGVMLLVFRPYSVGDKVTSPESLKPLASPRVSCCSSSGPTQSAIRL